MAANMKRKGTRMTGQGPSKSGQAKNSGNGRLASGSKGK